jgi:hypothetical protein
MGMFRDRRSLGGSRKPAGVLVGHTEGITNVSAKGDGRYVISNGTPSRHLQAIIPYLIYLHRQGPGSETMGPPEHVQQR